MKKIFLSLLIITSLYANDIKLASKIFNNIISEITQKTNSKVYLHTNIKSLEEYQGSIVEVYDCEEADVVILSTLKNIPDKCNGKVLFGTRYYHLKNKKVIGAFFWQKGRPNILFYQKRLYEHSIYLSTEFNQYIED